MQTKGHKTKQNKNPKIQIREHTTTDAVRQLTRIICTSWTFTFSNCLYIKYIHLSVRIIPYQINPAACVVGVELFLWCHLLNSIVHEYSLTGQAILKAVQYHSCTISIFSFHLSFLLHSRWVGWNNLNNTLSFSNQTLQDKLMKP